MNWNWRKQNGILHSLNISSRLFLVIVLSLSLPFSNYIFTCFIVNLLVIYECVSITDILLPYLLFPSYIRITISLEMNFFNQLSIWLFMSNWLKFEIKKPTENKRPFWQQISSELIYYVHAKFENNKFFDFGFWPFSMIFKVEFIDKNAWQHTHLYIIRYLSVSVSVTVVLCWFFVPRLANEMRKKQKNALNRLSSVCLCFGLHAIENQEKTTI